MYASPGHSTLLTICATLSRAPWVRGYTRSSSPSEGWLGPGAPPLLHVVRMSPDPCDIAGAQTGRRPTGPPRPQASKAGTGRGGASGAGRSGPSSQLWRDPEGTGSRCPTNFCPPDARKLDWPGQETGRLGPWPLPEAHRPGHSW